MTLWSYLKKLLRAHAGGDGGPEVAPPDMPTATFDEVVDGRRAPPNHVQEPRGGAAEPPDRTNN